MSNLEGREILKVSSRRLAIIGGAVVGIVVLTVGGFITLRTVRGPGAGPLGDNPFVSGSNELKTCIRQAIGAQAFEEISKGKRQPTAEETQAVEACSQQERLAGRPQERMEKENWEIMWQS